VTEVTPGEWTEVVPASHGKTHVSLTVDGADVYLSNEQEPNQSTPYGKLVRDGDQFEASVGERGSILSSGDPITARAVNNTADVRAVYDMSVTPQPRREMERPGDSAARKDRRDTFTHTENVGATTNGLLSFDQAELDSNRYPVFVESATLSFQDRSVGEATYNVVIYRTTSTGSVVRVQRTGSNYNDVEFDPAIRLDDGDDVAFEVYNPDGTSQTMEAVLNYRYNAPGGN